MITSLFVNEGSGFGGFRGVRFGVGLGFRITVIHLCASL